MKLSRTLPAILFVLAVLCELRVFAQPCFDISTLLTADRAKEVMQDNEFVRNGLAMGNFLYNPLLIDGQLLDYSKFSIKSKGELTLIKGSYVAGRAIQIPFYVYLRRNGAILKIPVRMRQGRSM